MRCVRFHGAGADSVLISHRKLATGDGVDGRALEVCSCVAYRATLDQSPRAEGTDLRGIDSMGQGVVEDRWRLLRG